MSHTRERLGASADQYTGQLRERQVCVHVVLENLLNFDALIAVLVSKPFWHPVWIVERVPSFSQLFLLDLPLFFGERASGALRIVKVLQFESSRHNHVVWAMLKTSLSLGIVIWTDSYI